MKSTLKKSLPLLIPVAAIALIYFGLVRFFPLETREFSTRIGFWWDGIQEIQEGGLHGYLRNTCHENDPKAPCNCIALVHGLADTAMTWKKILQWPQNGWAEPVKIYAFDLPGSGHSPPPKDLSEYRVRNQAQKLQSVLAPLCPHWLVVGNSLGGWISAWMTLDWRDGVSKLILVDTAGLKSSANDKSLFTEPSVESLKELQSRVYFKSKPLPDFVWQAALEHMKHGNSRQVVEAQTQEDLLDDKFQSIHRPTLILWGAADRLTPVTNGKAIHEMIQGSIWEEAPQCGHMPQKECPVDLIKAMNQMIRFGAM